ncbi:MAG: hypothetical protein M3Q78_00015, partial [Acidobacteriota bacterium]|nr:hypothetical protein [Acidobacteriota bacterium]
DDAIAVVDDCVRTESGGKGQIVCADVGKKADSGVNCRKSKPPRALVGLNEFAPFGHEGKLPRAKAEKTEQLVRARKPQLIFDSVRKKQGAICRLF